MPSPFRPFPVYLDHGANIPDSYAILLFTALDLDSITSHIHNWMLFLLWLCLFILSRVISPLISSSLLGTCHPGQFIFQCPMFLPFQTVHGVLKARILKWFVSPFSSGPHFVRTLHSMGLHMTHLSWVALHGMAHSFIQLDKAAAHVQRRQWQPTPVLLPGKSHGWESLVDCSPWGC